MRSDYWDTLLWLAILCKYLPMVVVPFVTPRLNECRNRGWCLAAAVLVLLSSAWALLEGSIGAYAGWEMIALPARRPPIAVSLILLLGESAVLVAFFTGLIGGIRTLVLLNNPQVKAAFRRD